MVITSVIVLFVVVIVYLVISFIKVEMRAQKMKKLLNPSSPIYRTRRGRKCVVQSATCLSEAAQTLHGTEDVRGLSPSYSQVDGQEIYTSRL